MQQGKSPQPVGDFGDLQDNGSGQAVYKQTDFVVSLIIRAGIVLKIIEVCSIHLSVIKSLHLDIE